MDQQYSERMGRHLAKLRQDKGLTQEQLAARLQVQGCDLHWPRLRLASAISIPMR